MKLRKDKELKFYHSINKWFIYHSEPKADVLNHYDIFPYTFVQHRVQIQKLAGEMYKFCVLRQALNISELYFIICKMGVLLPTSWWSSSLLEFKYLTPLAGKFV